MRPDPIFDYNFQIKDFYSKENANLIKNEGLCLDQFENTDWNSGSDVIKKISSFFENVLIRQKSDPFWMIDPDQSEIDPKKRILLLSNIEKQNDDPEDKIYEAQFQFNGQKEMIEFVYQGNLNKRDQFDGFATLQVVQKKMCFRGKCKSPSIELIKGNFIDGLLEGSVTMIDKYFVSHAKVKEGTLHGRLIAFGAQPLYESRMDKSVHLTIIGR
jgi:hypothetical protein